MRFSAFWLTIISLALSGCRGGDAGVSSRTDLEPPVVDPEPSALRGYYTGTVKEDASDPADPGAAVIGMISADGEGYFLDATNRRQLTVRFDPGDAVSGDLSRFAPSSTTVNATDNTSVHPPSNSWPQTTVGRAGTVSGSADETRRVDAAYTIDDESGTLSLQYEATMFEQPARLSLLTGDWSIQPEAPGEYGITLTFRGDGSFSGSDSKACAYNGVAAVPDGAVNAYAIATTVACAGVSYTASGMAVRLPDPAESTGGLVTTAGSRLVLAFANATRSYFVSELERKTP